MATLIFFDEGHQYQLNGEQVPSVSEISRFASREVYGTVEQFTLDNASQRGTAVHKATEILDKYQTVECTEDIENYVRGYVQFRKDFYIGDYVAIEKALAHEELRYAGTIDRIYRIDEKFAESAKTICCKKVRIGENGKVEKIKCEIDLSKEVGNLAVIDLKSSSVVQNVLALIQLNGYEKLVKANGIGEVGALFILHLGKDRNYELLYIERDDKLFMACLALHNSLQKKKRKKENE
jgi:hypothetical protein